MTLKLNGSSSGSVSIDAPASTTSGADITFKLPVADGSASQYLKTDGSGNLGWASDSGTWVKLSQVLNGGNVSDITFTSLDTTTYRAFKLMGGMRPVTDDVQLRLRFRVGSSDLTTSKYDWAYMVAYPDDGHLGAAANDQDYIRLFGDGGNTTREGWTFELLLLPHVDGHAGQIGNIVNWQGMRQDDGHAFRTATGTGYYDVDDQYVNGFKLYASSGNFVEHNYTLYGIKA